MRTAPRAGTVIVALLFGAALEAAADCCCGGGSHQVARCPCSWDGSFPCPSPGAGGGSSFEKSWKASEDYQRRMAEERARQEAEDAARRKRLADEEAEDEARAAQRRQRLRRAAAKSDWDGQAAREKFEREKAKAVGELKGVDDDLGLKAADEPAPAPKPAPRPVPPACLDMMRRTHREILVLESSVKRESEGFLGDEYAEGFTGLVRDGLERLARSDAIHWAVQTERFLSESRARAQACAEANEKAAEVLQGCSRWGVGDVAGCLNSRNGVDKCLGVLPEDVSQAAERAGKGGAIYRKFALRFLQAAQGSVSAAACLGK